MSHDTHSGHSNENKAIISFKNAFWLIIILVGLFVAALNFVKAESTGEEGEGHEGTKTEAANEMQGGHESEKAGEKAEKAEAPKQEEAKPAADTTHK